MNPLKKEKSLENETSDRSEKRLYKLGCISSVHDFPNKGCLWQKRGLIIT